MTDFGGFGEDLDAARYMRNDPVEMRAHRLAQLANTQKARSLTAEMLRQEAYRVIDTILFDFEKRYSLEKLVFYNEDIDLRRFFDRVANEKGWCFGSHRDERGEADYIFARELYSRCGIPSKPDQAASRDRYDIRALFPDDRAFFEYTFPIIGLMRQTDCLPYAFFHQGYDWLPLDEIYDDRTVDPLHRLSTIMTMTETSWDDYWFCAEHDWSYTSGDEYGLYFPDFSEKTAADLMMLSTREVIREFSFLTYNEFDTPFNAAFNALKAKNDVLEHVSRVAAYALAIGDWLCKENMRHFDDKSWITGRPISHQRENTPRGWARTLADYASHYNYISPEEMEPKYPIHRSHLVYLRIAGLLHDVGKVAYDFPVVYPIGLSEDELEQITEAAIMHPKIGALIACSFPIEVQQAIFYHHHRYDGNNDPKLPGGVKGDMLPYLGRILTVADYVDAMTARKTKRTAKQVVEYLKREDVYGGGLDPHLVDAFLAVYEENGYSLQAIYDRYKGFLPEKCGQVECPVT